jgi:hypothetical protein
LWERSFAELTGDLAPGVCRGNSAFFCHYLGFDPLLETLEVDILYGASAVAWADQWVFRRLLVRPVKSADVLLWTLRSRVGGHYIRHSLNWYRCLHWIHTSLCGT